MNTSDRFRIVLPSNSSMSIYPENKISSYTTQLANTLKLDAEKWEVAIVEFSYLHLWYNVREDRNRLKIITEEGDPDSGDYKRNWHNIYVPIGYYADPPKLIEKLNEAFLTSNLPLQFEYSILKKKTKLKQFGEEKNIVIHFGDSDIARLLGFPKDTQVQAKSTIEAPYNSLASNGIDLIYVYCNIIRSQYVGDFKVPLLRVIPVMSKYGAMCSIRFEKPYFAPINKDEIQTVQMDIRDEQGNLFPFTAGKVVVTLEFRRRLLRLHHS